MNVYEIERSVDGVHFIKMETRKALGNSLQQVNYNWFDAAPATGYNFYRVKAIDLNGTMKYTPVVKVSIGKEASSINVYPNPVAGHEFRLQLNNLAKGKYSLQLINNNGQTIYATSLVHNGGSANHAVELINDLPAGMYRLELSGEGVRMGVGVMSVGK